MTAWDKCFKLYIDVDAPGGGPCLLDGKSSAGLGSTPSFIQDDVLPLKLLFRRRAALGEGSSAMELEPGASLALAGKKTADAVQGSILFSMLQATEDGENDDLGYKGILNLRLPAVSAALGSDPSVDVTVDLEVAFQDGSNVSWRFSVIVYRQVYAGSAASPLAGPHQLVEEYTNANGALCVRLKNSRGEVLESLAPAGETP